MAWSKAIYSFAGSQKSAESGDLAITRGCPWLFHKTKSRTKAVFINFSPGEASEIHSHALMTSSCLDVVTTRVVASWYARTKSLKMGVPYVVEECARCKCSSRVLARVV